MFNMLKGMSYDKLCAGSYDKSRASSIAKGHVIGHMSSHSHMLVEVRVQVTWYFSRVTCSELKFVTVSPL